MDIHHEQREARIMREADLLEEVAREQEDVALYALMLSEAASLRSTASTGRGDREHPSA